MFVEFEKEFYLEGYSIHNQIQILYSTIILLDLKISNSCESFARLK